MSWYDGLTVQAGTPMAVNGDVSERPSPAKVRGVFLPGDLEQVG